jgi:hypothetical protein
MSQRASKQLVLFRDGAEENNDSDLTKLDIGEGEGLEECQDGGEEEEEEHDE